MERYFWLQQDRSITPYTYGWQTPAVAQLADDVCYRIAWVLWATRTNQVEVLLGLNHILNHQCIMDNPNDPLVSGESILNLLKYNIKKRTGAQKAKHITLLDLYGLVQRANNLFRSRCYPPSYIIEHEIYLRQLMY